MKALVYRGPGKLVQEERARPALQDAYCRRGMFSHCATADTGALKVIIEFPAPGAA
jgi:hypothetical protein